MCVGEKVLCSGSERMGGVRVCESVRMGGVCV